MARHSELRFNSFEEGFFGRTLSPLKQAAGSGTRDRASAPKPSLQNLCRRDSLMFDFFYDERVMGFADFSFLVYEIYFVFVAVCFARRTSSAAEALR